MVKSNLNHKIVNLNSHLQGAKHMCTLLINFFLSSFALYTEYVKRSMEMTKQLLVLCATAARGMHMREWEPAEGRMETGEDGGG